MTFLDRVLGRTTPAPAPSAIVPLPDSPPVAAATFSTFAALAKAFPPSLAARDYREIADAREVAFGGTGEWDRLPYRDLRLLADNADLLRIAIEMVINTIKGMDWSLATEDGGDPDPKAMKFLLKPDGKLDWDAWVAMALEEVLVCDNLCIFPYFKGGKLVAAEIIDGSTIKPKLDDGGRIPEPPKIAFEQFTSNNTTGKPKTFDATQLWYRPMRRRVYSVRGFSPTEQVAARAAINFHKMLRDLYRWQKGGTPAGLVPAPDGLETLEKLMDYQQWLDDRMKQPGADSRLQALLGGSNKYFPTPPPRIDKEHEELLIRTIFNAFGVDPTSMVSMVNRATAEALSAWSSLRGIRPHLFTLEMLAQEMLEAAGWPGYKLKWKIEQEAMASEKKQSRLDRFKAGLVAWEDMVADEGESVDPADVAQKHYFVVGLPANPFDPLDLNPKPEPPPPPPAGVVPPQLAQPAPEAQQAPPAALGKAIRDDLRRWETVVRKAEASGRPPKDFRTDVVPAWLRGALRKGLADGLGSAMFKAPTAHLRTKVKRWNTSERAGKVFGDLKMAAAAIVRHMGKHMSAAAMKRFMTAAKAGEFGSASVPPPSVDDWRMLVRVLWAAHEAGVDDSADLTGYGDLGNKGMDYASERAGQLIGQRWDQASATWVDVTSDSALDAETRSRIETALRDAIANGESESDLQASLNAIIDDEARAAVIAKTELAAAYNRGTAENWAALDVGEVEILDNEGPNSCDACGEANGQTWSIADYMANPTEHPNCVRAAIPVIPEGGASLAQAKPYASKAVTPKESGRVIVNVSTEPRARRKTTQFLTNDAGQITGKIETEEVD